MGKAAVAVGWVVVAPQAVQAAAVVARAQSPLGVLGVVAAAVAGAAWGSRAAGEAAAAAGAVVGSRVVGAAAGWQPAQQGLPRLPTLGSPP